MTMKMTTGLQARQFGFSGALQAANVLVQAGVPSEEQNRFLSPAQIQANAALKDAALELMAKKPAGEKLPAAAFLQRHHDDSALRVGVDGRLDAPASPLKLIDDKIVQLMQDNPVESVQEAFAGLVRNRDEFAEKRKAYLKAVRKESAHFTDFLKEIESCKQGLADYLATGDVDGLFVKTKQDQIGDLYQVLAEQVQDFWNSVQNEKKSMPQMRDEDLARAFARREAFLLHVIDELPVEYYVGFDKEFHQALFARFAREKSEAITGYSYLFANANQVLEYYNTEIKKREKEIADRQKIVNILNHEIDWAKGNSFEEAVDRVQEGALSHATREIAKLNEAIKSLNDRLDKLSVDKTTEEAKPKEEQNSGKIFGLEKQIEAAQANIVSKQEELQIAERKKEALLKLIAAFEEDDLSAVEELSEEIEKEIQRKEKEIVQVAEEYTRSVYQEVQAQGFEDVAYQTKDFSYEIAKLQKEIDHYQSFGDAKGKEALSANDEDDQESFQRLSREQQDFYDKVAGLRGQLTNFISNEYHALKQALQNYGEALEERALDFMNREGELLSWQVAVAVEKREYPETRLEYYQDLHEAGKMYRNIVDAENALLAGMVATSKKIVNLHEMRRALKQGMYTSEEKRKIGNFYYDEIMAAEKELGIRIPDRIPLLDRYRSENDQAYRDSGSMPRFFQPGLGTAIMFPSDGEVNDTDDVVIIAFHGATTQMSSINSSGTLINIINKNFTKDVEVQTKKGKTRKQSIRQASSIALSNPFHEFGPYDQGFEGMEHLMNWVDKVIEYYQENFPKRSDGGERPVILFGRSFGANVLLEHYKRRGTVDVIPMSGHAPTPYWEYYDFKALEGLGRTFNEKAVEWLDILLPQWTYHLSANDALIKSALILAGQKDPSYPKELPEEFPEEFLEKHPEYRGKKPSETDERALADYWQFVASLIGQSARLFISENGGHNLFHTVDDKGRLDKDVQEEAKAKVFEFIRYCIEQAQK